MLDVAYALKSDETRDSDQASLSAYIARGEDVATVADHLATEGSVALFHRALDEADDEIPDEPEEIRELSEPELVAGITNLMDWAKQVNGQR